MFGLTALAAGVALSNPPRFELAAPLPTIPSVMLDTYANGVGLAIQTARSMNLQARILWIDATANIDRYNTESKIKALVAKIKDVGFNTIVFDVKPISGQVVYPSKIAPKLREWRGQTLPEDFDPLGPMVREAHADGLSLFVSLNAFSEGHQLFQVGPGYERKDWQTVLYDTEPIIEDGSGAKFPLAAKLNVPEADKIEVCTDVGKAPRAEAGAFAVTLRKTGEVVDGFEGGGLGANVPTLPKGGVILYGPPGEAADFLRLHGAPGRPLQFDTLPVFVPIGERPKSQIPLMVNPNSPEVQAYELSIAREVVKNYDVDGILYDDRLRYAGLSADFSEVTRKQFEHELGKSLKWPDDVFKLTLNPDLTRGVRPGQYYDQWMAFRAATLSGFVSKVRQIVREERPTTQVGLYVGSWYGEYPALGNNYAAPDTEAGFWFLTPKYRKTGLAGMLDFLISGCYYTTATIYDAMGKNTPIGATIEGAGMLSNRLARDETWTYCGISLEDFRDNPNGLKDALQAACGSTEGVMVFDLSHNIEPMWPVFKQAFLQPRTAPHAAAGVLMDVRRRRAHLDALGQRLPPVILTAGSAGTGQ